MSPQAQSEAFQAEALAVIDDLRGVFAAMIEAKCGPGPAVTDIAGGFGIHRKLAWQLSRVAYDQDPFVAARHMPSPKGIESLLSAAAKHGVDGKVLERVERAAAAFGELVKVHAGDRGAFDLMLGACSAATDDDEAARWRQQSFVGNSFIWGAHCKTMLAMVVQFPSADRKNYFDMAMVRGLIGLRLNRPQTYWLVGQSAVLSGDSLPHATRRQPLDPEGAGTFGGVPVLRDHCRGELPGFERRKNTVGLLDDLLVPSAVGLKGERTIVTGEVIRALAPAHRTEADRVAHFGVGVRTPVETFVMDHFTHESLFVGVHRELCVYNDLNTPTAHAESDRLQVAAKLQELGPGLDRAQCRDVPGYLPLARDVFARLGQDPAAFVHHRVRIAYPPMPASVMIRHELPEPFGGDLE